MLSKVVVVTLISLLFMTTVRSQSNELLVQGQTGNLYLQHTVVVKENWYSIGRLYNLNPKDLPPYNKLTLTQPLSIGQELQIPLTPANFSQNGLKLAGETLVPLYYIIQDKEWLYRISVNHNKVPITSLEKWNNINKDQVKAGMHIIVGYLKVKTALSALATRPVGAPVAAAVVKPAGNVDTKTTKSTDAGAAKYVDTVAVKKTDAAATKKEEIGTTKKEELVSVKNQDAGSVKDTVQKKVQTASAPSVNTTAAVKPVSATGKSFNGGYFKTEFSDGGKSASGQAGIFKSTSGWQDGKYYALINNIPVGTIVKITDGASGKSIYAKVLGQLPDMKESAGLTVRISNAAAGELGQGDNKFIVEIRY